MQIAGNPEVARLTGEIEVELIILVTALLLGHKSFYGVAHLRHIGT